MKASKTISLAWIYSGFAILVIAFAWVYLLPHWVAAPDLAAYREKFPLRLASFCQPEPLEQLRYVFAIVAFPSLFYCFSYLFSGSRRFPFWQVIIAIQALVFVFCGFLVGYQQKYVFAYFDPLVILRFALQGGMGVAIWIALRRRFKVRLPRFQSRLLAFAIAGLYPAIHLLPSIHTLGNVEAAHILVRYHIPFTFAEFAAVLDGRTPLVDFFPQYQLILAYLTAPVFHLVGLSVTSLTVVLSVLSWIGLILVFQVFLRIAGDPWRALVLFLPFVAISFHPIYREDVNRVNVFNYFGVSPLRYFGVWVSFYFCAWYLWQPSRVRALVLFLVTGFAVVNNVDFGLAAAGGAFLAAFLTGGRDKKWLPVLFISALVFAFVVFDLLTYVRSGAFPDFEQMILYRKIFGIYGFFMLPMPPFGLHWIFYFLFMACIAVAVSNLRSQPITRESRLRDGLLIFTGVFGAGALFYYVGRSTWEVLIAVFPAAALALMLLTWFQYRGWLTQSAEEKKLRRLPLLGLLIGFFVCWAYVPTIPSALDHIERLRTHNREFENSMASSVQFVRVNAKPQERVGIIFPYGDWIGAQAGVLNRYPYAQLDSLLSKSQTTKAVEFMKGRGIAKVFGFFSPELKIELERAGYRKAAARETFEFWLL